MNKGTFRIEYNPLREKYLTYSRSLYSKDLKELNSIELQNVVASVIKNDVIKPYLEESKDYYSHTKIAVYFSMEFLIGRIVLDALINTGLMKITRKIFANEGIDINILEEVEDTALGNGGLGRLAACLNNNSMDMNRLKFQMIGLGTETRGLNLITIKPYGSISRIQKSKLFRIFCLLLATTNIGQILSKTYFLLHYGNLNPLMVLVAKQLLKFLTICILTIQQMKEDFLESTKNTSLRVQQCKSS